MALPNNNISAGAPPLLWSNVKDALDKINDNFIALDLATGGTAVDLSVLNTDVSPEYTDQYTLGTVTNQWKRVHSAAWSDTLAGSLNGLWAGQAQIKGYEKNVDTGFGGPLPRWIIDLPVGSTVDGQLIIDPDKTFIKTIQVDGDKSLESTVYGFTANFTSGLGIGLTVTSSSDEIEFAVDPTFDLNGSILADDTTVLVDRAGYIRGNVNTTSDWTSTVNGNVWSFKDTGLLQFPGNAVFGYVAGEGDKLSSGGVKDLVLSTNQSVKVITDADAGVVTWSFNETGQFVVPGPINFEYSGTPIISISTTTTSGRIIGETNKSFSVVLTDGTTPQDWTFNTNGSIIFPELTELGSIGGVGTFGVSTIAGSDFIIETDNGTSSTWTFGADGTTTFGTNQTVETDGFHGDLYGNVTGDLTGNVTGDVSGNAGTVTNGVYTTGDQSIGGTKTFTSTISGSITGNAGTVTNGVYTSGSYSDPSWLTISKSKVGLSAVENTALSTWAGSSNITTVGTLGSLSVTNNVGAGSFTGNIFTSLIDSADSSAITVTPATIFSSDVNVENELRVQGSKVINLATIKSIVAASTTWGDFQAAIAAL